MKPIYYKKYEKQAETSFLVKYAEVPHTYDKFHFHKEYELLYNIKNSGTRFVGDSISRFNSGDLVLVGPNIPHYWHSDEIYFQKNPNLKAKVILAQFTNDFVGAGFSDLPEMKSVKNLFERASQGVQIRGEEADFIGKKIIKLKNLSGWKQIVQMIEILCLMGEASDYQILASRGFCESYKVGNEERISKIFNYMIKNYHNEFNLDQVASYANMNTSAFCRYFKKSTSKTFSEVLNEIRIGFACKKLISSNETVSQIAYSCGYMNVPYFHRQFKHIKKRTPEEYRQAYTKEKAD